mmetsp:Transcript_26151/g.4485  ORF Transcript_26151/g.4485 Transcript_26151/m.4485 type:complete len:86 (+) Transcript_26151:741-998(+)|eukprot:CAMPEP_0168314052 /NCGR_PEP_ID=MMETSP0210-20121227/6027_1 /TAXON_ID=40633 /ORGANISM="Condylostoma magnum, Strain COL2" /LENGTH=85 /DNA_ID=CAMNT_0008278167 /DNA_START=733 /DNA_END=990 /DNA_ORIENTATION=+
MIILGRANLEQRAFWKWQLFAFEMPDEDPMVTDMKNTFKEKLKRINLKHMLEKAEIRNKLKVLSKLKRLEDKDWRIVNNVAKGTA